jgi:hypothetical protein
VPEPEPFDFRGFLAQVSVCGDTCNSPFPGSLFFSPEPGTSGPESTKVRPPVVFVCWLVRCLQTSPVPCQSQGVHLLPPGGHAVRRRTGCGPAGQGRRHGRLLRRRPQLGPGCTCWLRAGCCGCLTELRAAIGRWGNLHVRSARLCPQHRQAAVPDKGQRGAVQFGDDQALPAARHAARALAPSSRSCGLHRRQARLTSGVFDSLSFLCHSCLRCFFLCLATGQPLTLTPSFCSHNRPEKCAAQRECERSL